jgi:hypothetical protein
MSGFFDLIASEFSTELIGKSSLAFFFPTHYAIRLIENLMLVSIIVAGGGKLLTHILLI